MTALLKVLFFLTYASVQNSRPVQIQQLEMEEAVQLEERIGLDAQGGGIQLNAEEFKMLENGEIPERLREAVVEGEKLEGAQGE